MKYLPFYKTKIMTVEQIRNHIENDIKILKNKIQINGTKKCWNEVNISYSSKIQTLQDILIFIDTNTK